jgi:hypothetical protein
MRREQLDGRAVVQFLGPLESEHPQASRIGVDDSAHPRHRDRNRRIFGQFPEPHFAGAQFLFGLLPAGDVQHGDQRLPLSVGLQRRRENQQASLFCLTAR